MLRTSPSLLPPIIPPITPPITPPISRVPGGCVARLVWNPVNDSMGKIERDVAPGEPAFIRRLPPGVEYTLIKTIFIDLPSGLPTLLWAAGTKGTSLLRTFNERTVRAIDRALRHEENSATHREHAAPVRHELAQLCVAELNSPWSPHPERWIAVRLVLPQAFAEGHRPPGPATQHLRITVHSTEPTAVILDQRFVGSQPPGMHPFRSSTRRSVIASSSSSCASISRVC
jgi:hypothetical protein